MRGARGFCIAATATAAVLGAGLVGGCTSSTPKAAGPQPGTTTTSANPSPVGSHCPPPAGTEVVNADGISTVNGQLAITGYVESAECGPGVPDDVILTDTGPRRTFVIPADVRVVLMNAVPPSPRPGTYAELEALLQSAFEPSSAHVVPKGFGLWSHDFSLTLGSGGKITGIQSLYQP